MSLWIFAPGQPIKTWSHGNAFHVRSFCDGNHRSPAESPHKGPVKRSVEVFCVVTLNKLWMNNRDAGDLRHHDTQSCDVTIMPMSGTEPVGYGKIEHVQGPTNKQKNNNNLHIYWTVFYSQLCITFQWYMETKKKISPKPTNIASFCWHSQITYTWWRHQMELSALLALYAGNSPVTLTKVSDAGLWCFLWSAPEQTVVQTIVTPVIWDAIVLIMTSR